MNINKKKAGFIGVVALLLSFIIGYGLWGLDKGVEEEEKMINPAVPSLSEESEEYQSRMEAVDGLREERQSIPPSLYPNKSFEETGEYDPYLEEKEKKALMDSILKQGPDVEEYGFEKPDTIRIAQNNIKFDTLKSLPEPPDINPGQGHLDFFFVSKEPVKQIASENQDGFLASVNGDQVVRKDERLELRVEKQVIIAGDTLPRNTILYAGCSFRANRLLLEITGNAIPGEKLVAYDLSDGLEGIYIENSFRSQVTTEVLDDVIQDINISGVPQVRGLKGIFQRNNRNVKVKVLNQHQLILKTAS
ncbi:conjugative transposon protein TraM [Salegentibacter sp. LM13S]|uniref:conjugative transposon protein TraM n=1 Tax=Salegentibacter lacus TaxID=2873599 RepID=UPI001CCBBC9A|nr:conjugative transposon protein TraM [Salegentibacter lacus]MBZ9629775.1 conjugative transposon protein TraM [Salegentibacter lacus]